MSAKYLPLSKDVSSQESGMFSDTETDAALEQNVPKMNKKCLRSPLVILTLLSILSVVIVVIGSRAILEEGLGKRKLPTPRLPTETTIFQNYSDFSSAPTPENNALWMDLLGPGMGFVAIQNPSQYGLPEGISNNQTPSDVQVYGVSMYHQLHCLMKIRDLYWAALRGEWNLKVIEAEREELLTDVRHTNHCFDYIRQAIMCAGDMSIEGAATLTKENETPHINGYGSRHECKSYQASRDWMDTNDPGK